MKKILHGKRFGAVTNKNDTSPLDRFAPSKLPYRVAKI